MIRLCGILIQRTSGFGDTMEQSADMARVMHISLVVGI
jgi:hypothetical protein